MYIRLAGHEGVNDAEQLSQDPTLRFIGPKKSGSHFLPAVSTWLSLKSA